MKKIVGAVTFFVTVAVVLPSTAHAIIILPPIILVSVVNIVAAVIAWLTAPASILSGAIVYLKKPINKKMFVMQFIVIAALILCALSIIVAIAVKIANPARPWL